MERIETTILRNLIFNEEYSRKVIPFIQPECGRVVVFPPTWEYPHSGLPPSDCPKYILSTYIHYGTN